jgi:hypothetical protein
MNTSAFFPPLRRKRAEFLKSPRQVHGHGIVSHAHSHTRGELPGRFARNWKPKMNLNNSASSPHS